MRKSIGRKILTMLIGFVIVFVLMLYSNIAALGVINEYNDKLIEYMALQEMKGDFDSAFDRVRLLEKLVFYTEGSSEMDAFVKNLENAVSDMSSNMSSMASNVEKIKDDELSKVYKDFESSVTTFSKDSNEVLQAAKESNYELVNDKVNNSLEKDVNLVQTSQQNLEEPLQEKIGKCENKSELKITGTEIFDVILTIAFLVAFALVLIIVNRSIVKPARISGKHINQIVDSKQ